MFRGFRTIRNTVARSAFVAAGLAASAVSAQGSNTANPFSFEDVEAIASDMAEAPHMPPEEVSGPFLGLTYDKYRCIAPRFDKALWRSDDNPYWVEPHHAGFLFPYRKRLSIVDAGQVEEWTFTPDLFQYRGPAEPLIQEPGGGFAGFRVLTRFGDRPNPQEFASFLGASYFRVLGAKDWYGASTRGLAIDVGLNAPEEFPRFIRFWLEKPEGDDRFKLWALMDSPAAAGAYEFTLRPGDTTAVDVRASVFFRHGVQKLGIAPITSMWMWEGWGKPADDPRSEVHDSDGLLVHAGDAWTWRPLRRPERTVISRFPTSNLKGFGLMQRDREYENYADNESRYQLRPNVWVEPLEDWGQGHVELLELTATHEGVDNIGAYWTPERPTSAGARYDLSYVLHFGQSEPNEHGLAKFTHTIPRSTPVGSAYFLVIEGGSELHDVDPNELMPAINVNGAELWEQRFERQPDGNYVLSLDLRHEPQQVVDCTAVIYHGDTPITETWSYRWTPQPQ